MPWGVIIALLLVGVIVLGFVYWSVFGRSDSEGRRKQKQPRRRDRDAVLRDANRALANNPRDHRALRTLADIYYEDESWDKAAKTYGVLMDMSATVSDIDEYEVTLRYGLTCIQLKRYEDAYKSLVVARSLKEGSFELDWNLGYLEYRRNNTERAIRLLRNANELQPEHIPTRRYLGRALHKVKRNKDAVRILRQVVDVEPDDRESLFFLAQSYYDLGQNEQALNIFSHLRPDPILGPHSALFAGTIRVAKRETDKAVVDFELGLRHEQIKPDVQLELRYRLADAYTKQQELGRALQQLNEIQRMQPGYKDVSQQIARTKELHGNRHLQTYLIAGSSEFVTLCRRMVAGYFDDAKIKILDVQVAKAEHADILTDVETVKWQDTILFRFIRNPGTVGELVVREFNARLKETRAGRGYCVSPGSFSETAESYVEARLIDLLGKNELLKLLGRLD